MKKRLLATVMATLLATTTFIGCGSSAAKTESGDSGDVVQLKFWGDWTGEGEKWMDQMIAEFEKDHPNIKVDYQPQPELLDKLVTSIAAGDTPDILFWDRFLTPTYASKGFLLPIDSYVKDNNIDLEVFTPGGVEELTIDGKLYGLPITSDTRVLAYNKTIFDEVGVKPPTTWDELLDVADKTTIVNKGKSERWLMSTDELNGLFPTILQAGGYPVKDGKLTYDTPEAAKAVDLWAQMVEKNQVILVKENLQNFVQGKAVMFSALPSDIKNLESLAAADMEYGFIEPVAGPNGDKGSMLGGYGLTIPAKTKYPEEAFTFINWWATNAENSSIFTDLSGDLPANREALQAAKYSEDERYVPFVNALEYARPRPAVSWWEEVESKVIIPSVESFAEGKTSKDELLKKIDKEGNELISTIK